MINLAGYSIQGKNGENTEEESALVFANGYRGAISFPFYETKQGFMNNGKCLLKGAEGHTPFLYGPVPFSLEITELLPPNGWENTITRIIDENENTVDKEPAPIHIYFIFCATGYNPNGERFNTYDPGFEYFTPNELWGGANLRNMRIEACKYIEQLKGGKGQAIMKLNGKYAATGKASGNILNGLKRYEEGFPFVGTCFERYMNSLLWKYDESGIRPSMSQIPALNYPPSPINVLLNFHNGGVVPCNQTITEHFQIGVEGITTAGGLGYTTSDWLINRELYNISHSGLDPVIGWYFRNPFQGEQVFTGYDSADYMSPRYSYGFIATSEAIL